VLHPYNANDSRCLNVVSRSEISNVDPYTRNMMEYPMKRFFCSLDKNDVIYINVEETVWIGT
jgi:hypothetical protein